MQLSDTKKILLRWCGWFFIANVFVFSFIGLNYLATIPWVGSGYLSLQGRLYVMLFVVTSYFGQFALFSFVLFLFSALFVLFFSSQRLIFFIAILSATLSALFLILDTLIYKLYHFHLNGVMLQLITHGLGRKILGLSTLETIFAIMIPCFILILEWMIGAFIWRRLLERKTFASVRLSLLTFFGICLYFSYTLLIFSMVKFPVSSSRVVFDAARFLPFYIEAVGLALPDSQMQDIQRLSYRFIVQPQGRIAALNYPPILNTTPLKHPMNIVVILIDTWRFDMLKNDVTPFLSHFAKQSWEFKNHFSGGDATAPGVFSLFYALPATYWGAMTHQHRSPVLMDEMQKQHYQMGIFSSASLKYPEFSQNVFAGIKNLSLETPGATPDERDRKVTQDFKKFILKAEESEQPFFSFVFYDTAHSYCEAKKLPKLFQPMISECNRLGLTNQSDPTPYFNRYKNALFFVDQQIEADITLLKEEGLLDNTLVIITGDHGEEFNDNHLGFWGHAGNFTHFQVQTPLIVHWPHKNPAVFTYQTSHYDIAPTLMTRVLGSKTALNTYSLGKDLLNPQPASYLIVGSYIDFGVILPNRIMTVFPAGDVEIDQPNGRPWPHVGLDVALMQQVFHDMRRFYHDDNGMNNL